MRKQLALETSAKLEKGMIERKKFIHFPSVGLPTAPQQRPLDTRMTRSTRFYQY